MEKRIYGHGDVFLIRGEKIPDGAKPIEQKTKNPTLAFGEVTGHAHQISQGAASLFTYNDKTYMKVQSKIACLTHEEHKEIELPEGTYEIEIHREYEPGGWKAVID